MYGTVAVCRVLPADVEAVRALARAEDEIGIDGYLGTDVLLSDNHDSTLLLVVRFRDRASYVANARSPEQDARYQQFRALMQADPVWFDGQWLGQP